jgi:putative permease
MIALAYIAVLGKRVLCPLIFAFLFSLLLLPFAKFLEAKFRFKRSLAALVAVIVLEVLLAIFFYFIASRANDLIKDWPELSHRLSVTFDTIQQWIASSLHIDLNKQEQYIHNVSLKFFP